VIRNGNRIIAEWKNDEIHGQALIFYQNGIYFKNLFSDIEVSTSMASKLKGISNSKAGSSI